MVSGQPVPKQILQNVTEEWGMKCSYHAAKAQET
jgi:hypothetical protein